MATHGTVGATGNSDIDGLLSGDKWTGTLTYSFADSSADYEFGYGDGEHLAAGFAQISASQQTAVHAIMALVEAYTDLEINFAGTNGADIRLAQSSKANPTAYAYYPGDVEGGDVWFGTAESYRSPKLGDYSYFTHIHELGHALGLKHAHELEGVANVAVPAAHDSVEWTVMSYRSYAGADQGYSNETFGYPTTFMRNDIRALQEMYGADFTTNSDDTVYAWSPSTGEFFIDGAGQGRPGGASATSAANVVFMTIWDGGGIDTYDLSSYTTGVTINLTPGLGSTLSATQLANLGDGHIAASNVYNAYQYDGDARSLIENATGGSGADSLIGNIAGNRLSGGTGNDTLTGGAGNDTFVFGDGFGFDTITDFSVTSGDVIDLSLLTGFDTLADVVSIGAQSGANTILQFTSALKLTLQNVTLAALTDAEFGFTGGTGGTGGSGGTGGDPAAPTQIAVSKLSVAENTTGLVGLLKVADPNGDTDFTFTVSDDRFAVAGTAGSYQLVLKSALDFETVASVPLTITATDGDGLSKAQDFAITVTNQIGASISGSAGSDTINGTVSAPGKAKATDEADIIGGLAGNDTISGLGDNDQISGGLGNDTLDGGAGDDMLNGGAGADMIGGGANGAQGDTASYSGSVLGVTVDLSLAGPQGGAGDAAGDTLMGIENVTGSAKADTITGDGGDNVIEGGLGNDVLAGGAHGLGGDTVSYKGATLGVKVSLASTGAQNTVGAGFDTLSGFENVLGSKMADTIEGDSGANRLDGGAGIDWLSYASDTAGVTVRLDGSVTSGGNAAGDTILGFENLRGGGGGDTLGGTSGANMIEGGAGDDTLAGYGGTDSLVGGLGSDTADFAYATAGVSVSLAKTTAQITGGGGTVTLKEIEALTGSAYADVLNGNIAANKIGGGEGDDVIEGGAGADTLDGGDHGTFGDTVSYALSTVGVTIDLSLAGAQAGPGDGAGDMLTRFENILGSARADVLTGDGGDNVIEGGLGDDTLSGGDGSDTLSYARSSVAVKVSLAVAGTQITGAGTDTVSGFENLLGSKLADKLTGDDGDNVITGGLGLDILAGGGGADTFAFTSLAEKGDRISDFEAGTDIIELRAAGFQGTTAGAVNFASGSTPIAGSGMGWLLYDTDDGKLYYDADGAGAQLRQHLLTLDTKPDLSASDIAFV